MGLEFRGRGQRPVWYQLQPNLCGSLFCLAIRSDGSLVAWGQNTYGQCNVPAGNNYTQISAGGSYALAIRSDGSLAAWGSNTQGQCNVPGGNNYAQVSAGA